MSLRDALSALAKRFAVAEEHLNRLDAATGDGDHGSTMARGMAAVAAAGQHVRACGRAACGACGVALGLGF